MAKISIEIDTETKTISVNMAGEVLDKVGSIYVYKYEDYEDKDRINVEVTQFEQNEEKDINKTTRYSCCATEITKTDNVEATKAKVTLPKVDLSELSKVLCPYRRD